MKKELDKSKLNNLNDVRKLMYKLIQEQLRKPMLHEIVGRDLSQKIFNMDYEYLNAKEQAQFDYMLFSIALESSGVLVLGHNLSEKEQSDLKTYYKNLQYSLKKEMSSPDYGEGDICTITDEHHPEVGAEVRVKSIEYVNENWVVQGMIHIYDDITINAASLTKKQDNTDKSVSA